jgi:hypothetical protein
MAPYDYLHFVNRIKFAPTDNIGYRANHCSLISKKVEISFHMITLITYGFAKYYMIIFASFGHMKTKT